MSEQSSDYDGAWKDALRCHLPSFVEKYFPAVHAAIDWTEPLEWLDKEVSQVLAQPYRRNREVDVLVKARLRSGHEQWILMHLEIQSSYEEGFEARLARYNGGLFWVFGERVVTLVVLADLRKDWLPREDVFQVADFESRLRFPACKLIARLDSEWHEDRTIPVQIARAQIEALRTVGDPEARYRSKWRLVRSLYEQGYNADEIRELFRLIDWMMHLRDDLGERFEEELIALEDSLEEPHLTSLERIWLARGEARGRATVVLAQLRKLCGSLTEEVEARIRNLSLDRLDVLGEAVLELRSLQDLEAWLDSTDRSEE